MSTNIPQLNVGTPTPRAHAAAKTLLEAFYLQDERESHVLRGDEAKARETGDLALERMADAYETEFPTVAGEDARLAGTMFMRALFLQDEIENWTYIADRAEVDEVTAVLLSDPQRSYGRGIASDTRWAEVSDYLEQVCAAVDIDPEYATRQTRFWRLHGQINEYWEEDALEAHRIKLRRMLEPVDTEAVRADIDALARYFVAGVEHHDEWGHQNREADLDGLRDIVATYYQKIFELREEGM